MTLRPLTCTRCGQPVGVAEDVESCIDWGPAVVDDDGTVYPQYPDPEDNQQEVDSVVKQLRVRAFCVNPGCQHQWTLRRRFDSLAPSE